MPPARMRHNIAAVCFLCMHNQLSTEGRDKERDFNSVNGSDWMLIFNTAILVMGRPLIVYLTGS